MQWHCGAKAVFLKRGYYEIGKCNAECVILIDMLFEFPGFTLSNHVRMQSSKIKHFVSCLFFLSIFVSSVFSQEVDVITLGNHITERLARELSLSPSQQDEVARSSKIMVNQVVSLLEQNKSTGKLDTAMARQIFSDYEKELKESFTNTQARLYRTHTAQRRAEIETRLMALELDLTEKQLLQLEKINQKSAGKMVTEVSDSDWINMSIQETKDAGSVEKTLSKKEKKIKNVLTPAQWAILEQNRHLNQKIIEQRLAVLSHQP